MSPCNYPSILRKGLWVDYLSPGPAYDVTEALLVGKQVDQRSYLGDTTYLYVPENDLFPSQRVCNILITGSTSNFAGFTDTDVVSKIT